jgi:hypothetical protein
MGYRQFHATCRRASWTTAVTALAATNKHKNRESVGISCETSSVARLFAAGKKFPTHSQQQIISPLNRGLLCIQSAHAQCKVPSSITSCPSSVRDMLLDRSVSPSTRPRPSKRWGVPSIYLNLHQRTKIILKIHTQSLLYICWQLQIDYFEQQTSVLSLSLSCEAVCKVE